MEYEAELYDCIRTVAERVRHNCAELARRAYHHTQRKDIDLFEYLTLSESSTFLAFVELGGDVDDPLRFDWKGNFQALVTVASGHVRRDLQERGSDAYDQRFRDGFRNGFRKDGASVEEFRWDSWDGFQGENRIEREQLADLLAGTMPELQALLPQRDYDALTWRYVDGVSQKDIAQRLAVSQTAASTMIWRATRKAQEVLGPRWRQRTMEAVAA